jgi:hypothetical protein
MKQTILYLLITALVLTNGCSSDTPKNNTKSKSQSSESSGITRVGYWKENQHRVFTFNVTNKTSDEAIRNHARSQMHTAGRATNVFYYTGNAPDITLSKDRDVALTTAERYKPIYRYDKYPNSRSNESDISR